NTRFFRCINFARTHLKHDVTKTFPACPHSPAIFDRRPLAASLFCTWPKNLLLCERLYTKLTTESLAALPARRYRSFTTSKFPFWGRRVAGATVACLRWVSMRACEQSSTVRLTADRAQCGSPPAASILG